MLNEKEIELMCYKWGEKGVSIDGDRNIKSYPNRLKAYNEGKLSRAVSHV